MKNILSSNKGITLIEILTAIVILSIIAITFMSIFVQSSRTNTISESMMDAHYIAQTHIEEVVNLSNSYRFSEALSDLEFNKDYEKNTQNCASSYCYSKDSSGYYVTTEFKHIGHDSELVNVIVKVFNNRSLSKQEAQIETILKWKE